MASYLLLRDNKESGPLSLDELVSLGLKPYDLIWIEGRSAAWRYPSEIPELKNFAPVVEEQPYDRFFKKPLETSTPEPVFEEKIKLVAETKPVIEEPVKPKEIFKPKEEKKETVKPQPVISKSQKIEEPGGDTYQDYLPKPRKQVFVSMPNGTKQAVSKPQPQKQAASYSNPEESKTQPERHAASYSNQQE